MSLRTIHTWRRDIRIAILGDWAIFKPTKKRVLKDNAANSIAIVSSADDDSWVNEKWNEATSSIGDSLKCAMCHKPASELRVDVCYDCFRIWALSCKPKKKTKQS
jgi:hypothetical protein